MIVSSIPARATEIRQRNSMLVLSSIYNARNNGGISQTEIITKTGLKAPSVFRIFTMLQEKGYIIPSGKKDLTESRKGRHPAFYTVCPTALYTIGIEFWSAYLSFGIFDFNRHRIYSNTEELNENINADDIVELIWNKTNEALSKLEIPKIKLKGMGVAAPGKVDVINGSVVFYPRIKGMKNYKLKEKLENKLNLNVTVHNNCGALAYSVYRYGDKNPGHSMFAFLIRGGINGAMVSDNGIYTTADGTTLEAGHIPISLDGPMCSCGQKGCLQAHLKETSKTKDYILFDSISLSTKNQLKKYAFYIFRSMKIIQRTLSPDSFLIICPSVFTSEIIAEELRELYNNSTDFFQNKIPDIFALAYDNSLAQAGASDLALDRFFLLK